MNGPFIYDDLYMIVRNSQIQSLSHFSDYFTQSATEGFNYTSNLYRPLSNIVNAITYAVFEMNQAAYHIRNILIHIINGFLVFLLCNKLSFKRITSFVIAILFLAHPTQVESVSYIAGLPDVLHALFILLGLVIYIDLYKEKSTRKTMKFVCILICFILSLLTKESSIVFFPLAVLINLFQWKTYSKQAKSTAIKYIGILGLIAVSYMYLKLTILTFKSENIGLLDSNQDRYATNIHMRLAQFIVAIYEYFKIILLPIKLTFEKSFEVYSICLKTSCFYINLLRNLSGAFGIAVLAVGSVLSIISLFKKRIFSLGFAWFFIALAPVSNVIIPTNAPYKEHWLYIPIIGILILIAPLIEKAISSKKHKVITSCAILMIVTFHGVQVINRNAEWANPEKFFLNEIQNSPNIGRIRAELGYIYYQENRLDEAEQELNNAIELYQKDETFFWYLGLIQEAKGEYNEAKNSYIEALEINPKFEKAKDSLQQLSV